MLKAQDFTRIGMLADIGGGNGSAITAIMRRYPAMQGILFDLPGVVEGSGSNIEAAGLEGRGKVRAEPPATITPSPSELSSLPLCSVPQDPSVW
jgi:hypothetical protein